MVRSLEDPFAPVMVTGRVSRRRIARMLSGWIVTFGPGLVGGCAGVSGVSNGVANGVDILLSLTVTMWPEVCVVVWKKERVKVGLQE